MKLQNIKYLKIVYNNHLTTALKNKYYQNACSSNHFSVGMFLMWLILTAEKY